MPAEEIDMIAGLCQITTLASKKEVSCVCLKSFPIRFDFLLNPFTRSSSSSAWIDDREADRSFG